MKRHIAAATAIVAQFAFVQTSLGQTPGETGRGEPSGIRESARTVDLQLTQRAIDAARIRIAAAVPERKPDAFVVIPAAVWGDGVTIGGASAAYVSNAFPGHPVQARGIYRLLDLDGVDNRHLLSLDAKVPLVNQPNTRLTPYGEIRKVLDTSRKYRVGGSLEHTLARKVTLAGNLEYANSKLEGLDGTGDLIPAIGVTYAWSGSTETSIDYVFKNDVDGEYDVSFTLLQQLWTPQARPPLTLVFGVARHRTVFISLVQPFAVRRAAGATRR